MLRNTKLGVDF